MAVFGHRAGVLDLHRAPAGFVVRRFEVHGHAGFDRNIGRVGEERIVDFFGRAEKERKLALQTLATDNSLRSERITQQIFRAAAG